MAGGAISPHDGGSQGNNVPSIPKGDGADPNLSNEGNATQNLPAVQALLDRWLGDNASAVIWKEVK